MGDPRPVAAVLGLIVLLLGVLISSPCWYGPCNSSGILGPSLIILGIATLSIVAWSAWRAQKKKALTPTKASAKRDHDRSLEHV